MRSGQGSEVGLRRRCQLDPDDPVVVRVGDPVHKSCLLRSVDKLHDAVMTEQEVLGHLADRGWATVPSDGEEELVL